MRAAGIPSVAVSPKNGRFWRTYYAGPSRGEDSNNYVVLSTRTGTNDWQDVLVYDPDGDQAPDGTIHVTFDGDRFDRQEIFHVSFTEAEVRAADVKL